MSNDLALLSQLVSPEVLEQAKDALAVYKGGAALWKVYKSVVWLAARYGNWRDGRGTTNLREALDREPREQIAHLLAALHAQGRILEPMAAKMPDLEQRIEELTNDHQHEKVLRNFYLEASREAINERERMLWYAQAGTVTPGLGVAAISRAERTIRELDPDDVLQLYEHALDHHDGLIDHTGNDGARVWWEDTRNAVLATAGCVYPYVEAQVGLSSATDPYGDSAGHFIVKVTPLGTNVLKILAAYIAVRKSPGENAKP